VSASRFRRIALYADLVAAILISLFLTFFIFQIPNEAFPSILAAMYAKLLASLLLGSSISLAVLIAVDLMTVKVKIAVPKPPRPVRPRVRPISEEIPFRVVSGSRVLRALAEKMSLGLAADILRSGETMSPYKFATKYFFYTLVAFFVSIPLGVALALLAHPLLLSIIAVPAIPLSYPKLKLKSTIGDRKRSLEDEVPFFTVFASILQSVGISLYNSLLMVVGAGVFKQIERDAMLIKRDVEFFFKSPVEALEDVGRRHPNEKMRSLLLGYTSEWRSGGDMSAYLDAKADDYLKDMEFRWRRYAERASDMGEAMISLLMVFPMMILMAAFIFPGQALTMTSMVLTLIVPTLTVAVFGSIHASQPKTYDIVRGYWQASAVAGALSLIVSMLLQVPPWLCAASGLAAATALYGASSLLQMREMSLTEQALPQFLRDITEYRKMGYDVVRAIMRISEENTYNSVFDAVLESVGRQLELGVRMVEVKVPTRSWLTKMCFFLLAQVVESGGGTAKCLETLTNFVNQVVRVKREVKMSMRLYQALSLLTPIALSFIVGLMFTLLSTFSAAVAPGVEAGLIGEIAQIPEILVEQCYLLVVASSICVALLSAKAVDLTAKNTLWITVNLILASAGISLSTYLGSLLIKSIVGV
jgi:flagellar protein FlaJ